jgi:hypothetical protein
MKMSHGSDSSRTDTLLKLKEYFIFVTTQGDISSSGLLHLLAVLSIDKVMDLLQKTNDFSCMLARVFTAHEFLQSRQSYGQQKRTRKMKMMIEDFSRHECTF